MVTWHALCLGALLIAGIIITAAGMLKALAGGMSDAPAEGESMAKNGCITALIGLAAMGAAIVLMVRG